MRRVVITGLGSVNPIGNNVNETWDSIVKNKCGVDNITYFDTTDFKVKLAAEVKNFNPEEVLDPKAIRTNDKFTVYGRIAALEAVKDSNLNLEEIDHDKFGCIVSSGIGGIETIAANEDVINEKGPGRVSPHFIPKSLINLCAGQIAIDFGCKGYVSSTVTACAGGNNAIGDAYLRIKFGQEDIMLAGGAEAAITPLAVAGFMQMKALCTSTDKTAASIPFDARRGGFVMGEGAGILVLEELEHAKVRNAKIYAEVIGYGVSCDAYHITAPSSDGMGGYKAMKKALDDANITPNDINYINAHGTSTHLNDSSETMAIKKLFGKRDDLLISSTKSNTGHLLGASGAVEAVICAKAITDDLVPATINYKEPDPECDLNYVPNNNIKTKLNYVLSNSLGFGGHNACLVFKKYGE